jgi:hypothetical protein
MSIGDRRRRGGICGSKQGEVVQVRTICGARSALRKAHERLPKQVARNCSIAPGQVLHGQRVITLPTSVLMPSTWVSRTTMR